MIIEESPRLEGLIRRHFPLSQSALLKLSFAEALRLGGAAEIDFVRDPEVSVNPRPARIAEILLKETGISSAHEIAAGMLACAPLEALTRIDTSFAQAEELRTIAQAALRGAQELSLEGNTAISIACVLWLDRARHYHLAPEKKQADLADWFFAETDEYLQLAKDTCPRVYTLLTAWKTRSKRRASYKAPFAEKAAPEHIKTNEVPVANERRG